MYNNKIIMNYFYYIEYVKFYNIIILFIINLKFIRNYKIWFSVWKLRNNESFCTLSINVKNYCAIIIINYYILKVDLNKKIMLT